VAASPADVNLILATPVRDRRKFALPNDRTARIRPLVTVSGRSCFELVVGLRPVGGNQFGDRVAAIEAVRIDLDAQLRELPQVQLSLGDLFVLR
jgi:hypothetical protein